MRVIDFLPEHSYQGPAGRYGNGVPRRTLDLDDGSTRLYNHH